MPKIELYVPGKSILHRLHPSTKLVLYISAFAMTYALPWQERWFLAAGVLVFLWIGGLPPTKYKVPFLLTMFATLTVPLLNGFWSEPNDPLILPLWDGFGIHRLGLESGLSFAGLYTAIGMATISFIITTKLWELAEAPTMLGAPHQVGFALAYAFRYMPEVVEHYLHLTDVWRTRGVVFEKGTIWEKFWLQCRLLAALLILEFSQVKARSNAVEARGFSMKEKATYFILPPIPLGEKVLMAIVITLTLVTVIGSIVTLITPYL